MWSMWHCRFHPSKMKLATLCWIYHNIVITNLYNITQSARTHRASRHEFQDSPHLRILITIYSQTNHRSPILIWTFEKNVLNYWPRHTRRINQMLFYEILHSDWLTIKIFKILEYVPWHFKTVHSRDMSLF